MGGTQEPSGETFTVVCNQAELTIGGNANSAYVAGQCAHLIVKGSHNKVVVDNADAIDTDGSGNQVVYTPGRHRSRLGEPRTSSGGAEIRQAADHVPPQA